MVCWLSHMENSFLGYVGDNQSHLALCFCWRCFSVTVIYLKRLELFPKTDRQQNSILEVIEEASHSLRLQTNHEPMYNVFNQQANHLMKLCSAGHHMWTSLSLQAF